jgi:hypothetical protein
MLLLRVVLLLRSAKHDLREGEEQEEEVARGRRRVQYTDILVAGRGKRSTRLPCGRHIIPSSSRQTRWRAGTLHAHGHVKWTKHYVHV